MQGCAKIQIWPLAATLLVALVAVGLPAAGADEPDPPSVPLDRLLKLPSSVPVHSQVEKHGGSTRSQWQARFDKARKERETAREALKEVRAALEEASEGDAWKMTAPGLGGGASPSETPLDFKLSQDLKRSREELERTERQIQDLEVEANLAGVPEDWYRPDVSEDAGEEGVVEPR